MDAVLALDRIDEPTLDWFHGQRRALAIAAGEPPPASQADSRAFLAARPEAVASVTGPGEYVPILHRWLGAQSEALERTLIDVGAIAAAGFRPR